LLPFCTPRNTEVILAPRCSQGGGGKGAAEGEEKDGGVGRLVFDPTYLAFDYHRAMLAGLALVMPTLRAARAQGRLLRALVIGLGGGALPMALRRVFPCLHVTVRAPSRGDVQSVSFAFFSLLPRPRGTAHCQRPVLSILGAFFLAFFFLIQSWCVRWWSWRGVWRPWRGGTLASTTAKDAPSPWRCVRSCTCPLGRSRSSY
jgi:hypothetical protein